MSCDKYVSLFKKTPVFDSPVAVKGNKSRVILPVNLETVDSNVSLYPPNPLLHASRLAFCIDVSVLCSCLNLKNLDAPSADSWCRLIASVYPSTFPASSVC